MMIAIGQMPIFHEHTSDFDDWWCKSGFADVDKLTFFRCPKKRVRFDKAKNKIWTIDRYDDKENDKLIFFQPPKKRVRFDEAKIKFGRSIDMMIKKMTS